MISFTRRLPRSVVAKSGTVLPWRHDDLPSESTRTGRSPQVESGPRVVAGEERLLVVEGSPPTTPCKACVPGEAASLADEEESKEAHAAQLIRK